MEKKKIVIPTLTFNSDYFEAPKVRLIYPGPLRVLGNVAHGTPANSAATRRLSAFSEHKLRFLKKQSENCGGYCGSKQFPRGWRIVYGIPTFFKISNCGCNRAGLKSAVVWRPLCWMVQRKQQGRGFGRVLHEYTEIIGVWHSHIWGDAVFRYKTKSRIGDLHKSWETVFRLLHCRKTE